ncbi:hypothetical protein CAL26_06710 [Bordetella genomosp. 9]|uniref:Peptidase C39-like domain-containing protein n=1 Tax=Bordetella genomosp. 9 TaxID=1416803 RepID=A0A261RDX3_9BORD|nr:papain-like cysteine protease family protein [Bordetella genomosp. 9]OZI23165.1 hypothetical protein CAL26_06710 [Bordetella genomosp. 9]
MDPNTQSRLPACLALKPLSLDSGAQGKTGEFVGTPGGGATTAFPGFLEGQQHTQWCWAAVATGLGNYYQSQSGQSYTQLQIYCAVFGLTQNQCSGTSYTDALCNRVYELVTPLQFVGAMRKLVLGMPSRQVLRTELVNDRPFAVYLSRGEATAVGHFVVISAYNPRQVPGSSDPVPMWYVCDPWAGGTQRWVVCDTFPEQYPGDPNTTWGYTYYTARMQPGSLSG